MSEIRRLIAKVGHGYMNNDPKTVDETALQIEALISTEVAKAKIAENQEELAFNLHVEKSAGFKAGFNNAVSQLVKYRDLRIEELRAEVESNE